jgi:hypothetical protein
MLKIKIKSGQESRQGNSNHYSGHGDGYDEFGEYARHQVVQDEEINQPECSVCGGEISNTHLVFSMKNSSHEVHTSCLITSVALISNGIAIVAGFFRRRSKSKNDQLGANE